MHRFYWRLTMSLLICGNTLFAHKQPLHQHITREAFRLLVLSHPQLANSEMATYVGTNETSTPYDRSWGAGKIVSGAWIEDEYDIVYHYGIGNKPTFNQWYANAYAELFPGGERQAFVSIAHFWNADAGLNATTDLNDVANGVYWSFSCENAMQKMYKYLNGDFDNRYLYVNPVHWTQCENQISLGNDMRMGNLFELYRRTRQASCVRYLDNSGDWVPTNCPVWDYPTEFVYEQLGRMCHLLQDQSVPAHVHSNSHACTHGMYCDYYEENAPNYHLWTADEIFAAGGRYIDPFNSWGDPLYYLMYLMNQSTDHYASGRTAGDENYDPTCPALSQIISTLGLPVTQSQVDDQNCRAMHDKLMPLVIRATAGLLYWFVIQTDVLPNTLVRNSFSGGQIRINGAVNFSGYRTPAWGSPSPITLEAIDQVYNCCNYRFSRWRKLVSGREVQTWPA